MAQNQPGQLRCGAVSLDGVLTLTAEIFCNPAVALTLDDATNTVVTTVSGVLASGKVTIVVEVTPDVPIASADNTIGSSITNLNELSA